ncbi:MAG: hypothetical protein L3K08_04905 [Thermoplasmata archaeon]|nr:hypothetical protein [Thermoplasmata archaeon]
MVVLVVLGLSFTGLLGSRFNLLAPKSSGSTSVSFFQAVETANSSVQAQGGSWGLIQAEGFDVPGSGPYPFLPPNSSSPCYIGGLPTFANSAPGDAAKGLSPYWLFGFESTANLSVLSVAVVNGQAQVIGASPTLTACEPALRYGLLAPAASIEDSPAAVQSLPNLTRFVGSFPNSAVVFLLSDIPGEIGKLSGTASWLIEASPCLSAPAIGPPAGDPEYLGGTNGTTSHVYVDEQFLGFGACETPGTLGPALQLSHSVRVTSPFVGGTGYRDAVRGVNGTLTPSAFHPAVFPGEFFGGYPAGAFAPGNLNFSVLNGTNVSIANYNFTTSSWTYGASVAIVAGDSLELDAGGALEAASLVLVANAPTTGQIGIFLP